MKLTELIQDMAYTLMAGTLDTDITALEYDSRKVIPGSLFVCLTGFQADGHDYIPKALEAGAAALVCRHAFSQVVGAGRPDETDQAQIADFAARAAAKLSGNALPPLELDRSEIGPYYTPLKEDGTPAKFLKARPLTDWSKCSHCGVCARSCPMGSIDRETMEAIGLCVKCQACVRKCTRRAKFFEDADFLSHVAMLEQNYTRRAENTVLL